MLWLLLNWRKALALGLTAVALILVGGLYLWGSSEQASRLTAEASLAESQKNLAIAQKSIADMIATKEVMDKALSEREIEKEETQERLRSVSAELMRLRRQNAELRDWLDRPIPADVVRLLREASARGAGGKAVPSKDHPR